MPLTDYQRETAWVRGAIQEAILRWGYSIGSLKGIDERVFYGFADEVMLQGLLDDMVRTGELELIGSSYHLPAVHRDRIMRDQLVDLLEGTDFEGEEDIVRLLSTRKP